MCGDFPEIRVSRDERRRLLLFCLTPANEQRDFTSQMYDFSEKVNSVGAVYSASGFLQRIWERQWIWKTSLISSPHHVGFHKGPNHLPEWKLTTTSCLFPGRSFPVRPRSSRLRHVFCSTDRHHVTTSRDRILSVSQPILCQARRGCSGDLSGGCWFVWSQLMRTTQQARCVALVRELCWVGVFTVARQTDNSPYVVCTLWINRYRVKWVTLRWCV